MPPGLKFILKKPTSLKGRENGLFEKRSIYCAAVNFLSGKRCRKIFIAALLIWPALVVGQNAYLKACFVCSFTALFSSTALGVCFCTAATL
jgi:hypothetical protein